MFTYKHIKPIATEKTYVEVQQGGVSMQILHLKSGPLESFSDK